MPLKVQYAALQTVRGQFADAKIGDRGGLQTAKCLNSLVAEAADAADAAPVMHRAGRKTIQDEKLQNAALPALEALGVEVAFVISEAFGQQLVAEIIADAGEDGLIAFDTETKARPDVVARLAALRDSTEDRVL